MKTQILLFALITLSVSQLTASSWCTCSEITYQSDCTAQGCVWATVNSVSTCSTLTISCTAATSPDCDAVSGCAWTNAGNCAAFTKCSDYTVTTAGQCQAKDSSCIDGTASGASIPCATAATPSVTCSTLTSTTCSGTQSDGKMCYYTNSACAAYDVSSCSAIKVQDLCEKYCAWTASSSSCAAKPCASITDTTKCTYVWNNDLASITLCLPSGSTCANAADTTTLTSANCYANTDGTYSWDGSACSACTGSESNSYLLAFISIMSIILM